MKSLLLMTVVVLVVVFAVVGLAYANGGPHGGYTSTTDARAGCHRAHTAIGPYLLVASSTYALCESCHGAGAAGANTNVDDGYFLHTRNTAVTDGVANTPDNSPLLGGGFVNYTGVAVSSSHPITGSISAAYGAGGAKRGAMGALASELDCASCHNPHGSTNYRIINTSVNGITTTVTQVDEGTAKDYHTEQWSTSISQVCKSCHTAYHVTKAGSGHDKSGTGSDYGGDTSTFAHRVDMSYSYGGNVNPETTGVVSGTVTLKLPLAGLSNDTVVCTTCHMSHGTSVRMTGFATGSSSGPTGGAALLRLDNRGVCEVCHQK